MASRNIRIYLEFKHFKLYHSKYLLLSETFYISFCESSNLSINFIYLSIYLFIYLSICLSGAGKYRPAYDVNTDSAVSRQTTQASSIHLSYYVYLAIFLYVYLSIYLYASIHLSYYFYLTIYLYVYLSSYLSLCLYYV